MQIDLRKNMALKYSKIIVGGCSFTDKNYPKTARPKSLNFKMWPEIMGDKLNCEVINTAKCGFGNQAIFHETLTAIMNNDNVDHVIVMWSDWTRQDFLTSTELNLKDDYRYTTFNPNAEYDDDGNFNPNAADKTWYEKTFKQKYPTVEQIIDTNINYMYSLQTICEKLNIKYTALGNTVLNLNITGKELIDHPFLEKIKNFMGWPLFESIGGYTVKDLCKSKFGKAYQVSSIDAHPNEESHKFIADKIMEYINE